MRIQAGSALVESGCPPVGSDPQRPRRWSRQNAVRGGCSPEPGLRAGLEAPNPPTRPRGRELRGGDAGVMSADYCTERGTSIRRTSAWRPLFPESHPTLETQRSRKFRKRNCRRISRSLGTVSQASRRRLCTPDTTDAVKAERPWQRRSLRTATFRVPGAPPSAFYAERAPGPSRSPGSGAVVGRAPAASRFRPRPHTHTSRSFLQERETWTLRES